MAKDQKKKRGFFRRLMFWRNDSSDEESEEETKSQDEKEEENQGEDDKLTGYMQYHAKCFIPLPRDTEVAEEDIKHLPSLRQVEYGRPTTIQFYTDILEHPIYDAHKQASAKKPSLQKAPVYKMKGSKAVEVKIPKVHLKMSQDRKETSTEKPKMKRSLAHVVTQVAPPPAKKVKATKKDILETEVPMEKLSEVSDKLKMEGIPEAEGEVPSTQMDETTVSAKTISDADNLKPPTKAVGKEKWKEIDRSKVTENKAIKKWKKIIESKITGKYKDGKKITSESAKKWKKITETKVTGKYKDGKKISSESAKKWKKITETKVIGKYKDGKKIPTESVKKWKKIVQSKVMRQYEGDIKVPSDSVKKWRKITESKVIGSKELPSKRESIEIEKTSFEKEASMEPKFFEDEENELETFPLSLTVIPEEIVEDVESEPESEITEKMPKEKSLDKPQQWQRKPIKQKSVKLHERSQPLIRDKKERTEKMLPKSMKYMDYSQRDKGLKRKKIATVERKRPVQSPPKETRIPVKREALGRKYQKKPTALPYGQEGLTDSKQIRKGRKEFGYLGRRREEKEKPTIAKRHSKSQQEPIFDKDSEILPMEETFPDSKTEEIVAPDTEELKTLQAEKMLEIDSTTTMEKYEISKESTLQPIMDYDDVSKQPVEESKYEIPEKETIPEKEVEITVKEEMPKHTEDVTEQKGLEKAEETPEFFDTQPGRVTEDLTMLEEQISEEDLEAQFEAKSRAFSIPFEVISEDLQKEIISEAMEKGIIPIQEESLTTDIFPQGEKSKVIGAKRWQNIIKEKLCGTKDVKGWKKIVQSKVIGKYKDGKEISSAEAKIADELPMEFKPSAHSADEKLESIHITESPEVTETEKFDLEHMPQEEDSEKLKRTSEDLTKEILSEAKTSILLEEEIPLEITILEEITEDRAMKVMKPSVSEEIPEVEAEVRIENEGLTVLPEKISDDLTTSAILEQEDLPLIEEKISDELEKEFEMKSRAFSIPIEEISQELQKEIMSEAIEKGIISQPRYSNIKELEYESTEKEILPETEVSITDEQEIPKDTELVFEPKVLAISEEITDDADKQEAKTEEALPIPEMQIFDVSEIKGRKEIEVSTPEEEICNGDLERQFEMKSRAFSIPEEEVSEDIQKEIISEAIKKGIIPQPQYYDFEELQYEDLEKKTMPGTEVSEIVEEETPKDTEVVLEPEVSAGKDISEALGTKNGVQKQSLAIAEEQMPDDLVTQLGRKSRAFSVPLEEISKDLQKEIISEAIEKGIISQPEHPDKTELKYEDLMKKIIPETEDLITVEEELSRDTEALAEQKVSGKTDEEISEVLDTKVGKEIESLTEQQPSDEDLERQFEMKSRAFSIPEEEVSEDIQKEIISEAIKKGIIPQPQYYDFEELQYEDLEKKTMPGTEVSEIVEEETPKDTEVVLEPEISAGKDISETLDTKIRVQKQSLAIAEEQMPDDRETQFGRRSRAFSVPLEEVSKDLQKEIISEAIEKGIISQPEHPDKTELKYEDLMKKIIPETEVLITVEEELSRDTAALAEEKVSGKTDEEISEVLDTKVGKEIESLTEQQPSDEDLERQFEMKSRAFSIPEEEVSEDIQKEIISEAIKKGIIPQPQYYDFEELQYEDLEKKTMPGTEVSEIVEEETPKDTEVVLEPEISAGKDISETLDTKIRVQKQSLAIAEEQMPDDRETQFGRRSRAFSVPLEEVSKDLQKEIISEAIEKGIISQPEHPDKTELKYEDLMKKIIPETEVLITVEEELPKDTEALTEEKVSGKTDEEISEVFDTKVGKEIESLTEQQPSDEDLERQFEIKSRAFSIPEEKESEDIQKEIISEAIKKEIISQPEYSDIAELDNGGIEENIPIAEVLATVEEEIPNDTETITEQDDSTKPEEQISQVLDTKFEKEREMLTMSQDQIFDNIETQFGRKSRAFSVPLEEVSKHLQKEIISEAIEKGIISQLEYPDRTELEYEDLMKKVIPETEVLITVEEEMPEGTKVEEKPEVLAAEEEIPEIIESEYDIEPEDLTLQEEGLSDHDLERQYEIKSRTFGISEEEISEDIQKEIMTEAIKKGIKSYPQHYDTEELEYEGLEKETMPNKEVLVTVEEAMPKDTVAVPEGFTMPGDKISETYDTKFGVETADLIRQEEQISEDFDESEFEMKARAFSIPLEEVSEDLQKEIISEAIEKGIITQPEHSDITKVEYENLVKKIIPETEVLIKVEDDIPKNIDNEILSQTKTDISQTEELTYDYKENITSEHRTSFVPSEEISEDYQEKLVSKDDMYDDTEKGIQSEASATQQVEYYKDLVKKSKPEEQQSINESNDMLKSKEENGPFNGESEYDTDREKPGNLTGFNKRGYWRKIIIAIRVGQNKKMFSAPEIGESIIIQDQKQTNKKGIRNRSYWKTVMKSIRNNNYKKRKVTPTFDNNEELLQERASFEPIEIVLATPSGSNLSFEDDKEDINHTEPIYTEENQINKTNVDDLMERNVQETKTEKYIAVNQGQTEIPIQKYNEYNSEVETSDSDIPEILVEETISPEKQNIELRNNLISSEKEEIGNQAYKCANGRYNSNTNRSKIFWRKVANSIKFFEIARKVRNQRRVAPIPLLSGQIEPVSKEPQINEILETSNKNRSPLLQQGEIFNLNHESATGIITDVPNRKSLELNETFENSSKDLEVLMQDNKDTLSPHHGHEGITKETHNSQVVSDSNEHFEDVNNDLDIYVQEEHSSKSNGKDSNVPEIPKSSSSEETFGSKDERILAVIMDKLSSDEEK